QARDELARGARVDLDRAAGQPAGAVDGEGQRGAAVVVHLGAQVAQRVDERPHRTLPGTRVAVELHGTVGECGERGHEAHDRAGQAAVDAGRAVQRSGV